MKYRITYKCCHKTNSLELSIIDPEEMDDDFQERFVKGCIEHYKEEDGLGGLPHEIIKAEMSIDGEDWFLSSRFMNL